MTNRQTKKPTKKPTKTTPPTPPLVLSREDYKVDGGALRPDDHDVGVIDMTSKKITSTWRRAVTLQMPRGELGFYPIGAKIRVTIERLK